MLVVLRIASVRSDIGVFLNDPGPLLAGTIEKDAFTSLLCPKYWARGTCGCVTAPFRDEDRDIGSLDPNELCVFRSKRSAQRMAPANARYSQATVAPASAVISATS